MHSPPSRSPQAVPCRWASDGTAANINGMSKRSRILRTARAELNGTRPLVTKLKGPGDAIAMIPFLLGFTPHESLVVAVVHGPRSRFGPCLRMDLVTDLADAADQAGYTRALVQHHSFSRVMVFAFSIAVEPARTVLHAVQRELARGGVEVLDAVRADGTRWWSMTCTDPLCCGPEGTPYDVDTSRVAAEAVLAGLQRAPDRDALRAQVAPLDASRQAAVAAAVAARGPDCVDVQSLVQAGLGREDDLTIEEIASLAATVQRLPSRDEAWAMMSRSTADAHFALWRRVMQSVPDALLSPVGSLAAFAAWLSGHGVLASHAAERVLRVDPEYSMALLVVDALDACVHPDRWQTAVRPPVGGSSGTCDLTVNGQFATPG
jgi:Domain of unknown function (DUF4192)